MSTGNHDSFRDLDFSHVPLVFGPSHSEVFFPMENFKNAAFPIYFSSREAPTIITKTKFFKQKDLRELVLSFITISPSQMRKLMRDDGFLLIRNDAIGEKFEKGRQIDFRFTTWSVWKVYHLHSSKNRVYLQAIWPKEMKPGNVWVDINAENMQLSAFGARKAQAMERYFKRGKDLMKPGGCMFSAIECFNKVLEFDSESVQVHKLRAIAIHKSGQNLQQAIGSINKCVRHMDDDDDELGKMYNLRGCVETDMRQYDDAKKSFDLALSKGCVEGGLQYAETLIELSEFKMALSQYDSLLSKIDDIEMASEIFVRRGELLWQMKDFNGVVMNAQAVLLKYELCFVDDKTDGSAVDGFVLCSHHDGLQKMITLQITKLVVDRKGEDEVIDKWREENKDGFYTEALFLRLLYYFKDKRYFETSTVLSLCDQIVQLKNSFADVYLFRAQFNFGRSEEVDITSDIDHFLSFFEKPPLQALLLKCRYLISQGQFEEALQSLITTTPSRENEKRFYFELTLKLNIVTITKPKWSLNMEFVTKDLNVGAVVFAHTKCWILKKLNRTEEAEEINRSYFNKDEDEKHFWNCIKISHCDLNSKWYDSFETIAIRVFPLTFPNGTKGTQQSHTEIMDFEWADPSFKSIDEDDSLFDGITI